MVNLDVRNRGVESARNNRAVNVSYASILCALTRAFSIPAANASVRAKVWQVLEKNGERGRNRTYNLLIKSQSGALLSCSRDAP
jgi:hypothetical protein